MDMLQMQQLQQMQAMFSQMGMQPPKWLWVNLVIINL
jgi:hypothetical protein